MTHTVTTVDTPTHYETPAYTHPHITKHTHTYTHPHTLQNSHIHTHTHTIIRRNMSKYISYSCTQQATTVHNIPLHNNDT